MMNTAKATLLTDFGYCKTYEDRLTGKQTVVKAGTEVTVVKRAGQTLWVIEFADGNQAFCAPSRLKFED